MNNFSYAALAAMLLCLGTTSYAQTADGQTPAVETACDSESGAAFGLCNAYCEAMDCDSDFPQASDEACARVLDKFIKITGSEIPCSSHPVAGDSCSPEDSTITFDQSEAASYGCQTGTTNIFVLQCNNQNWQWQCSNVGGG